MQKPLVHCPPAVHGLPVVFARFWQVPAPSHERPWVSDEMQAGAPPGSSLPLGTNEQGPRVAARLQILQLSLQSVLQQTPSAQWPLAQSLNAAHCCPSGFLHCLLASQAWSLGQVSSGSPAGTAVHLPRLPATLQAMQVPAHIAAGTS